MNQKQLTTLIVLGLLIGGLGLVVSQRRASSWNRNEGGGGKVLGEFSVNDVAQLHLKQTNAELNLVKGEVWTVKERWGYPANFSEIAGFITKAAELKVVSPVQVGASQLGRLELLTPEKSDTAQAGTLVEFRDKDSKAIKSLLLGKQAMRGSGGGEEMGGASPVGRYLMVPGDVKSASIVSETFSEISTKPESWLNKDWFKVEKLKSISIVSTNATNNWKLARETETGAWSWLDKKDDDNVDTNKLSTVAFVLSSPTFNDVVSPEAKPEMTGMAQPLMATLETFDGFTYTVRVGGVAAEENYHLAVAVAANLVRERKAGAEEKPEDKAKLDKEFQEKVSKLDEKLKKEKTYEKWTYLVSKWTIDPLLKERKDFMSEKKEETVAPQPAAGSPLPQTGLPDVLSAPPFPLP